MWIRTTKQNTWVPSSYIYPHHIPTAEHESPLTPEILSFWEDQPNSQLCSLDYLFQHGNAQWHLEVDRQGTLPSRFRLIPERGHEEAAFRHVKKAWKTWAFGNWYDHVAEGNPVKAG